eukprot:2630474-Prymnesium_polylepis.1
MKTPKFFSLNGRTFSRSCMYHANIGASMRRKLPSGSFDAGLCQQYERTSMPGKVGFCGYRTDVDSTSSFRMSFRWEPLRNGASPSFSSRICRCGRMRPFPACSMSHSALKRRTSLYGPFTPVSAEYLSAVFASFVPSVAMAAFDTGCSATMLMSAPPVGVSIFMKTSVSK